MVTKWELEAIKSIDPNTMQITIIEFVDNVKKQIYLKIFVKTLSQEMVLSQLALFVKQKRQQKLDNRLPFNTLDLSNFEDRIDKP